MPLDSTSAPAAGAIAGAAPAPGPNTAENGGAGISAAGGGVTAREPPSGMPRMPDSVFASSSGSAYASRIVSSLRGPRAAASAAAASAASILPRASASLSCASATFVRTSASALSLASSTRAFASRSFASWSDDTIRMTLSRSSFTSWRASMIVSSASSHDTLRSEIDILPLTSSPMTMLRPLSAARMRRRFTTSASLKSSEIRR